MFKPSSQQILGYLKLYPIGTSMVIPGCNDGSFANRGGIGGQCDRDGQCVLGIQLFRECSDSSHLQNDMEMYFANEDNKCDNLLSL